MLRFQSPRCAREQRDGRITEPQLRETLGLARSELDGFPKSHGGYQNYTLADFEPEYEALKELGLWLVRLVIA